MIRFFILIFVLFLYCSHCLVTVSATSSSSTIEPQYRIINGDRVRAGEYPFVVHILLSNSRCTGMIIHEEWVLTAAHCFEKEKTGMTSYVKIFAGGVDYTETTDNTVNVNSKYIIVNPNYLHTENKVLNDIALIQVEQPFNFSAGCCIKSIRLTGGRFPGVKSMSCISTGFGVTSNTDNSNKKLNKLSVTASVLVECFRRSYFIFNLFNIHPYAYREESGQLICVEADRGKDTCYGDSGGPLVCNGLAAGVLSYGSGKTSLRRKAPCGTTDSIAVYMFTGYFTDWIRKYVVNLEEPGTLSTANSMFASKVHVIVTSALCVVLFY